MVKIEPHSPDLVPMTQIAVVPAEAASPAYLLLLLDNP
jgi:hypothetical protein